MEGNEKFIRDQLRQLEEFPDEELTPTINSLVDAYQDLLERRGLPMSWPTFSEGTVEKKPEHTEHLNE